MVAIPPGGVCVGLSASGRLVSAADRPTGAVCTTARLLLGNGFVEGQGRAAAFRHSQIDIPLRTTARSHPRKASCTHTFRPPRPLHARSRRSPADRLPRRGASGGADGLGQHVPRRPRFLGAYRRRHAGLARRRVDSGHLQPGQRPRRRGPVPGLRRLRAGGRLGVTAVYVLSAIGVPEQRRHLDDLRAERERPVHVVPHRRHGTRVARAGRRDGGRLHRAHLAERVRLRRRRPGRLRPRPARRAGGVRGERRLARRPDPRRGGHPGQHAADPRRRPGRRVHQRPRLPAAWSG